MKPATSSCPRALVLVGLVLITALLLRLPARLEALEEDYGDGRHLGSHHRTPHVRQERILYGVGLGGCLFCLRFSTITRDPTRGAVRSMIYGDGQSAHTTRGC